MNEKKRRHQINFILFLGKPGFTWRYVVPGIFSFQKPRFWADKLCRLPKPRSHSFWSGLKFSRAWRSPFSPTILKLAGGRLCSHTATTRGNEGSFVHWHLIWSGSVQWSPQISPGPGWVCVSASLLLPHGLGWLRKRSGLCGQTSKPSDEEWRCFFFFFPLVAACVCSCFNNYNFF